MRSGSSTEFALAAVLAIVLGAGISCAPHAVDTNEAADRPGLRCREAPAGGTLRWVDAPTDADQNALDDWCVTVGPPVLELDHSVALPPLDSLCIVTWNTEVGGGDLLTLVSDLRAGVLTLGRPVTHFIVLLQEAYRAGPSVPVDVPGGSMPRRKEYDPPWGPRRDIVQTAELLRLNLVYVPSMRNGKPGSGDTEEDRGNAILSTMALDDLTAIELPFEGHRRVAIAASVEGVTSAGRPWRLRVCCMHLDHRSRIARVFNSAGVGRLRQARALLDALPESPAVLAGDMNTWSLFYTESVIELVQEAFGQPVELDDHNTIEARLRPDRRVDYMFFRLDPPCRGRYERLDHRYGSDHWPLIGWVQLGCVPD